MTDNLQNKELLSNYLEVLKVALCGLEVISNLIPKTSILMEDSIENITSAIKVIQDKTQQNLADKDGNLTKFLSDILINLQFQDRCSQHLDCSKQVIEAIIINLTQIINELLSNVSSNNLRTNKQKTILIDELNSFFKLNELKKSFIEKLVNTQLLPKNINSNTPLKPQNDDDIELF